VIDMHHIISDGTSLNIFVKEFTQIYNGETLELPKYQYRDFSEWQNSVYNSTEFLKQKQFWLKKFQVIPQTLKLPMKQNAKDVKHIG
ncbi:condensation domain-containing protein, partial [Staphylococcus caprae]